MSTKSITEAIADLNLQLTESELTRLFDTSNIADQWRLYMELLDRAELAGSTTVPLADAQKFWDSREILRQIKRAAEYTTTSPYAVLASVLVRAVTCITPMVRTEGGGSLNLIVGVSGDSGTGKGAAETAAAAHFEVQNCAGFTLHPTIISKGSPEGFSKALARDVDENGEPTGDYKAAMVSVSEIKILASQLDAPGGDALRGALCTLWSGELHGSTTSDEKRRSRVPAGSFRWCLLTGVQPENAGAILDDTVTGLAQRMLWLPSTSGEGLCDFSNDQRPPKTIIKLPNAIPSMSSDKIVEVGYYGPAREEMRARRIAIQERRRKAGLDEHQQFLRAKLGCIFALLDGRTETSAEDWTLAGHLVDVSNAEMENARRAIREKNLQEEKERAEVDAARNEHYYDQQRLRFERKIWGRIADGGATRRELRSLVTSAKRPEVDELLDSWAASFAIVADEQLARNGQAILVYHATSTGSAYMRDHFKDLL